MPCLCPLCGLEFGQGGVERHIGDYHETSGRLTVWRCAVCSFAAATFEDLAAHCLTMRHRIGRATAELRAADVARIFACLDSIQVALESQTLPHPLEETKEPDTRKSHQDHVKVASPWPVGYQKNRHPSKRRLTSVDRPVEYPYWHSRGLNELESEEEFPTSTGSDHWASVDNVNPTNTMEMYSNNDSAPVDSQQFIQEDETAISASDYGTSRKERRTRSVTSNAPSNDVSDLQDVPEETDEYAEPSANQIVGDFYITISIDEWNTIASNLGRDTGGLYLRANGSKWWQTFLPPIQARNDLCTLTGIQRQLRVKKDCVAVHPGDWGPGAWAPDYAVGSIYCKSRDCGLVYSVRIRTPPSSTDMAVKVLVKKVKKSKNGVHLS